jgi:hypothetical protein
MTTLTRTTPAPVLLLEHITRWFKQTTHKERFRPPYRWYEVENCGMW